MAVGNVYETVAFVQFGEQQGLNVRHWRVTDQVSPTFPIQTAVNALHTRLGPLYAGVISTQAQFLGITIRPVGAGFFGQPLESNLGPVTGSISGDPLPRQVAGLIRWRTNLPGRSGRGRSYIPFPAETGNSTGIGPTLGYLNGLDELADGWFQPLVIISAGGTDVLTPTLVRRLPFGDNLITSFAIVPGWATQRRRSTFGRPNTGGFGGVPGA